MYMKHKTDKSNILKLYKNNKAQEVTKNIPPGTDTNNKKDKVRNQSGSP